MKSNFSESDILLCGLAFTSRTEALEDYLKGRVRSLTVISLSSCFLRANLSECRVYAGGVLRKRFKLANFRIKAYKGLWQPFILLVFIVNWAMLLFTVLGLRKKFDLCIGISHSFALIGALFKKIGITRKLIYYCIDYYIPENKLNFNSLFVKAINGIDRLAVRGSDMIWDISPNIAGYRQRIGRIPENSYRSTVVPLGYPRSLARFRPIEEINRWDIGFVGTITANQGLQLLVEAMPGILKQLPSVKVKIIGEGNFLQELKAMVFKNKLEAYFTFYGFIKDEEKMLDILSRSAIGVALWGNALDTQNITCADPGKTKLYAVLGLPIIVTKVYSAESEIRARKAGISIDYNPESLKEAVIFLLSDNERLKKFKLNSFDLGRNFVSENIFNQAFSHGEPTDNGL